MIIVKLMGGLGNQMFQYAFGKYLAKKNETELKLDTSFLLDRTPKKQHFVFRDYDLDIFNITSQFASKKEIADFTIRSKNQNVNSALIKILGSKSTHIKDMGLDFNSQHLTIKNNTLIEGYWQSEKYFKEISNDLKKNDFSFKTGLNDNSIELYEEINSINSVCINVRRGDFVINSFHGTMGVEYYTKAESILLEQQKNLNLFVFSDDIKWCEENLKFKSPTTFVSHNYAGHKFQDYLRLMAKCKHFIIPNSSFAWWAVWFSDNLNKTVIAPKNWINNPPHEMNDLIPEDWIRI